MANQTILTKKTKRLVRKYLEKVRSSGIAVSEAFVFGSQASGRAARESDIDLAVVSPQFGQDKHEDLVRLFKLIDKETKEVEPIPFSSVELKDKYDPLAAEVRRQGILVYP